jgi:predicted nucleotide-binding protein
MGDPAEPLLPGEACAQAFEQYLEKAQKYWTLTKKPPLQRSSSNPFEVVDAARDELVKFAPRVEALAVAIGLQYTSAYPFNGQTLHANWITQAYDVSTGLMLEEARRLSDFYKQSIVRARLVDEEAAKRPPPPAPPPASPRGTKVVICHGRSKEWYVLKDLLVSDLKLEVEEFNSVAVAGLSTKERLLQLKAVARFAFIVLTGEDKVEDADGEGHYRARENVIHEAGFFQSHLGFEKAIMLLEDGCKEFSNAAGIQQIRFPKDDVRAKLHEIRAVLEREKLLK